MNASTALRIAEVSDELAGPHHVGEQDRDDTVRERGPGSQLVACFLEEARFDHLADLVAELVPLPGHGSTLPRLPGASIAPRYNGQTRRSSSVGRATHS